MEITQRLLKNKINLFIMLCSNEFSNKAFKKSQHGFPEGSMKSYIYEIVNMDISILNNTNLPLK